MEQDITPRIVEETDVTDDPGAGQNGSNFDNNPSIGSFVWELARVVIVAFVVMLLFRFFIAEPFIVSGYSMVPNFHDREYLIVNKIEYRLEQPERGDVIVFKYPKDTTQYFIKRVIGLPGEKVKVADGHVIVYNDQHPDGKVLDEPYLPNQDITTGSGQVVSLGSDEYFVLGDNRTASSDSRVWGVLPKRDIVGKAWLRVFPIPQFGIIRHPNVQF
jgi:signal peptidase I